MVNTVEQDIANQLVEIYYNEEPWHESRMDYDAAYKYHKTRLDNGIIKVYTENQEVLGYYERYFDGNRCIIHNLWIKESCRRGRVFQELKRHFLSTLPDNIEYIVGKKENLGGKLMKAKIRRNYGWD